MYFLFNKNDEMLNILYLRVLILEIPLKTYYYVWIV